MDRLEQLKQILRASLQKTIGKIWNTEEDKQFLEDTATDIARYTIKYKEASTKKEREEAQLNLDMLQTNFVGYFHQKGIIAEKSAEALAKQVFVFIIEVFKRVV